MRMTLAGNWNMNSLFNLRMTLTEAHDSASIWRAISSSLDAFYRFSRPHTVIGTVKSCFFFNTFSWISSVQHLLMKQLFFLFFFSSLIHDIFWFKQALSIVSVSLLSVQSLSDISPLFFTGLLEVVKLWALLSLYKQKKNVWFHFAAFVLLCRQW